MYLKKRKSTTLCNKYEGGGLKNVDMALIGQNKEVYQGTYLIA